MLRLLTKDPTARANTEELLRHPWLVKHGVASDKPLDSLVIERMKKFAGMTKLKKVSARVHAQAVHQLLAEQCEMICINYA